MEELRLFIFLEINSDKNILVLIKRLKDRKQKLLNIKLLEKNMEYLLNIIAICKKDPISLKYYENFYGKIFSKTFLEKEILVIAYYKLLLNLNKYKFEDKFILKLKPLISKIYNKEVEFNIVNLKAIYLNSDTLTQAISSKLKNRENGLLRVLRSFLYMVKLPKVNVIRERFDYINAKNLWVNKVKNFRFNSLLLNNKDSINELLLGLFNKSKFNTTNTLLTSVLNSLKHQSMGGVRLEAKGRLTKTIYSLKISF